VSLWVAVDLLVSTHDDASQRLIINVVGELEPLTRIDHHGLIDRGTSRLDLREPNAADS
jgi:hypothetical protein